MGGELRRRRHLPRREPLLDRRARGDDEVGDEVVDQAADEEGPLDGRVGGVPPARRRGLATISLASGISSALPIPTRPRPSSRSCACWAISSAQPTACPSRWQPEPRWSPSGSRTGKREVPLPGRVLEDPLARLVRQVEPRLLVPLLEEVDDADRLVVVLEGADARRRPSARADTAGSPPVRIRFSAFSPEWPNGVCPRSCARAHASARSSFRPSVRAIVRATCVTSRVCVRRVR